MTFCRKSDMLFTKKLFSSKKSSPSSDSSSNSPIGPDRKKPKSNSKEETRSPIRSAASIFAGVKESFKRKHGLSKCKQALSDVQLHSPTPGNSNSSPSGSKAKKPIAAAETPIQASSLGLNRIKTRPPLMPQEYFCSFRREQAVPGVPSGSGQSTALPSSSNPEGNLELSTVENSLEVENSTEAESSGYHQHLLRMSSAPRKTFPGDIKSFSHELNSNGVRPFPLSRSNSLEEILDLIRTRFDTAKEVVDLDLAVFGADLLRILEKNAECHPELRVTIENLLILAQTCAEMNTGEFWLQCEGIVQYLDGKRQELPPGVLKKLHTRMLLILTRCSRLFQFHKESWGQDQEIVELRQSRVLRSTNKRVRDGRGSSPAKALKVPDCDDIAVAKPPDCPPPEFSHEHISNHRHNTSWGYWGEQSCISEESSIVCRICEENVPTTHVEDHSRVCALAERYVQKGVSIDERLVLVAETLEKIIYNFSDKDSLAAIESPESMKISNASLTGESDVLSPKLRDLSRTGSEDMLGYFPEADNSAFMDDMRSLPTMSCRTRFGPKSDQGMTNSSTSSMTPRSPIPTPRANPVELLFGGKGTFHDQDDVPQMTELADIARYAAMSIADDCKFSQLLLACVKDLKVVIERRKFDALIVETFGTRIEKLIEGKYLQLCQFLDVKKVDLSSTVINEDAPFKDEVVSSLRTSPVRMRDRISREDFEYIKGISKGAFGEVFLARKITTGDLFAIKVLKKADMIRKNAVESILSERDILIKAHNPFVVRFFYSFTSPENLYLVMEYLNGGDFYSMLKKVGCLEETNARVYIAEVVLALEYLHSEGIVHRDLKPDNLLIAHDGHVKLTDFGLSKVGLINSTDDLSGPVFSGRPLLVEEKPKLSTSEHQLEKRDKRSAVGTPDYLAPEILLGTGHGATADWWAVGIILFELIAGIPPFNAANPQQIFDNILNRDILWPSVPEEMSLEAYDLIDRLLTDDPQQRLGARGAAEVKQHIFFKDINWDTLAEQKAAFVPDSKDALDTSYFESRYPDNSSPGEKCIPVNENRVPSDMISSSNHQNDVVDERGGPAELENNVSENNPFENFSFKNLSQLAYINCDVVSKAQKDGTQPILHRRRTK